MLRKLMRVLHQSVKTWFYNRSRGQGKKTSEYEHPGNWTLRRVINHERNEEVSLLVEKRTGAIRGSNLWVAGYQARLTQVENSLSDSEKAEMRRMAVEWNEKGPPDDVKRK